MYRIYRGIGVCRVLSEKGKDPVVMELVTGVGTIKPTKITVSREQLDLVTRDVISPDEVAEVLDLLRGPPEAPSKLVWCQRRRLYDEAIRETVPSELAAHLRDLHGKPQVTSVERVFRDKMKLLLVDEIAVAMGEDKATAAERVGEALRARGVTGVA